MRLSAVQALIILLIVGVTTQLYRIIPFLFFREEVKLPKVIITLGDILPYAMMALLVVYSLRNINPLQAPYGLPEIIATSVVVLVHLWKGKELLSILIGTGTYMILVQFIFA